MNKIVVFLELDFLCQKLDHEFLCHLTIVYRGEILETNTEFPKDQIYNDLVQFGEIFPAPASLFLNNFNQKYIVYKNFSDSSLKTFRTVFRWSHDYFDIINELLSHLRSLWPCEKNLFNLKVSLRFKEKWNFKFDQYFQVSFGSFYYVMKILLTLLS